MLTKLHIPIETHVFMGDPNEFYCSACGRPRALHQFDGFMRRHTPTRLSTDPGIRYRGPVVARNSVVFGKNRQLKQWAGIA